MQSPPSPLIPIFCGSNFVICRPPKTALRLHCWKLVQQHKHLVLRKSPAEHRYPGRWRTLYLQGWAKEMELSWEKVLAWLQPATPGHARLVLSKSVPFSCTSLYILSTYQCCSQIRKHLTHLASELPLCEIDQVRPRDGDHGYRTEERQDGYGGGD